MRIGARVPISRLLPLFLLACRGPCAPVDDPAPPAAALPDAAPPADAAATLGPAPGWGAVFWRGETGVMVGEGTTLVGPRAVGGGATTDAGPCGGRRVENAPAHAVLAVPAGALPAAPEKAPVVSAKIVEAAAWRLDEALPAQGAFAPLDPDAAPPRQRGVVVGSVIKQRRYGGPPVYLAVGARDCTAAAVLLDSAARTVLDAVVVPGVCGPVRALPPAELDGQDGLETAMFDDETVVLLRLELQPATAALAALGAWRCPREAAQ